VSKQLLPVYDKPMIYYPLSVLMLAEIRDILIISTPQDTPRFRELLGDGSQFGVHLSYCVQPSPDGLAQAFLLGEEFIGDDSCAMVLGDNIFYGDGLKKHLLNSARRAEQDNRATIYGYYVQDPERFGVVEFDDVDNPVRIVEKAPHPQSNYAVTGLYFYPKGVSAMAKQIVPSARGELEITDLNNLYLAEKRLHVTLLGRGYAWLDTGTHESMADASSFVKSVEEHEGLKICSPEEIAYWNGWISKATLIERGKLMEKNQYGQHLLNVAAGRVKAWSK
jgi:glucose-1-phosphate thymidylyltransferase